MNQDMLQTALHWAAKASCPPPPPARYDPLHLATLVGSVAFPGLLLRLTIRSNRFPSRLPEAIYAVLTSNVEEQARDDFLDDSRRELPSALLLFDPDIPG